MRGFIAGGVSTLALVLPATSNAQSTAIAAKACSPGYTHAVIRGEQKCLRRGEFCVVHLSQYRRYGYECPQSGHLEPARRRH